MTDAMDSIAKASYRRTVLMVIIIASFVGLAVVLTVALYCIMARRRKHAQADLAVLGRTVDIERTREQTEMAQDAIVEMKAAQARKARRKFEKQLRDQRGPPRDVPTYGAPPYQGPPYQGPPYQGSPYQGPPYQAAAPLPYGPASYPPGRF